MLCPNGLYKGLLKRCQSRNSPVFHINPQVFHTELRTWCAYLAQSIDCKGFSPQSVCGKIGSVIFVVVRGNLCYFVGKSGNSSNDKLFRRI